MEKIFEFLDYLKGFIVKEFLWFFASLFIAMLLSLLSIWSFNEFSISLINRLEWQEIEDNSIYLVLIISWFVLIYLIRLIRNAILFLTLPKEEEKIEE